MAFVYADMVELNAFQELIETTLSPLRRESTSLDDLIYSTKTKLEEELAIATKNERIAQDNYYNAKLRLSEAETRTANYNRNLQDDQEPMTTPSFYYEMVGDCQCNMQVATSRRQQIETALSNFEEYSRKHKESQSNLIYKYQNLLNKSGSFFGDYITLLQKAKDAILQDTDLKSDGQETAFDGSFIGLDEKDINIIANATGWDTNLIRQKCGKDGAVYTYKTNNCSYENKLHSSGVFFERSQFEIGGIRFEGVFPKFNTFFEPPIMPKSLWNNAGLKYTNHFKYCNEQLKIAINNNPVLASNFNSIQLKQIQGGKTPAGFTWHHHQESGRMQLVRKQEHNSAFSGANHTGGGALWCR